MSIAIQSDAESPLSIGRLVDNNDMVESLRRALSTGQHAFDLVPGAIENLIRENAWQLRMDHLRRTYRFAPSEFLKFIESSPPDGIGTTPDEIRRYLGGSENPVRVMFEGQVARGRGRPVDEGTPRAENGTFRHIPDPVRDMEVTGIAPKPTIVLPMLTRDRSREPSGGNSIGYITRKLARERPDLLAAVERGEMKAKAAGRVAGFVKPTITLPLEPEAAARLIVKHFQGEALEALVRALGTHAGNAAHSS